MRHSRNFLRTLCAGLTLAFCLSACGTKGPLIPPPTIAGSANAAKPAPDDSKAPAEATR